MIPLPLVLSGHTRRSIFLLSFLCFSLVLPMRSAAQHGVAGGVKFFKGGWEDVMAESRKSGKYVFVDAFTDWCGWCVEMDKKTFSDATVAAYLDKHFVPVQFDMEEGDGLRLAMKYRVTGFPSFLIFAPDGRLVYKLFGYRPPEDFLADLAPALDPAMQLKLPGLTTEIDLPFPAFYRAACAKGEERNWPKDSTVAAFLEGQQDWFDEVSWSVLYRFGGGEKGQNFLLTNRIKLGELYGKSEVDEKIFGMLWRRMSSAAERKSRVGLDSVLAQSDTLFSDRTASQRWWLELNYCKTAEDWSGLAKCMDAYLDTATALPHSTINDVSWNLYEKCDEAPVLDHAIEWMKRTTEEKPIWMYLDTYAALLYKTARYPDAEREALRAIDTGKKEHEDTKSTEELLARIRGKMK